MHGSSPLISGGNSGKERRIVWKAMTGERMLLQHTTVADDQKRRFKFIKYPPCSPELCPPRKSSSVSTPPCLCTGLGVSVWLCKNTSVGFIGTGRSISPSCGQSLLQDKLSLRFVDAPALQDDLNCRGARAKARLVIGRSGAGARLRVHRGFI